MKLRKRNVLLLLAATMMFGLASVTPASSETAASTSTLNGGGVLRLRLGATDEWRFQPTEGSTANNTTQSVTSGSGCGLNAASLTGSLVKLTADNGSVGFVSDSLGVRGPGEGTGQPCGRIDGTQKLSVELGSSFTGTSATPKRAMDFAELDIEAKFNASVRISAYFGSGTTPVASEVYDTMGSDSGPDSGDLDNYRVRFPKTGKSLFTKLTISVDSGGASLEGGADGTQPCDSTANPDPTDPAECLVDGSLGETIDNGSPTTDSLFHLIKYDRVLNCNETETQTGSGVPTNSLQRVQNEGSTTCTGSSGVLVDLDAFANDAANCSTNQCVSLRKDLLGQAAQFFWTVTWTPESTTLPVKVTEFDFGSGYQPIQWCIADDADTDTFPERPPTANTNDPASAVDPWCLTSQHSDLDNGSGKITVKEIYFGLGDPGAKR